MSLIANKRSNYGTALGIYQISALKMNLNLLLSFLPRNEGKLLHNLLNISLINIWMAESRTEVLRGQLQDYLDLMGIQKGSMIGLNKNLLKTRNTH